MAVRLWFSTGYFEVEKDFEVIWYTCDSRNDHNGVSLRKKSGPYIRV